MSRDRRRGQTLIVFAIMMVFLVLGMLALVCDTAVMFSEYDKVGLVAEDCVQGAIAAGFAADRTAYYATGQLPALDAVAAKAVCRQDVTDALGPGAADPQIQVTGEIVTVTVSDNVTLPVPLWTPTAHVSVTRQGQLGRGA